MKTEIENNSERLNEIYSDPQIASILDRKYVRKKLIRWLIRNAILAAVYTVLWKYENIHWTLYITVPLAFISLLMILLLPKLLSKKLTKTNEKLAHLSLQEDNYTVDDYKEMYKEMEYDVLAFKELATKINHEEILELCDGFFVEMNIAVTVSNVEDATMYYNELVGYIRQIEDIIEDEKLEEMEE